MIRNISQRKLFFFQYSNWNWHLPHWMQYCYRYLLNCTQLCRNRHTVVTVNTAPAPQHNFGSTGSGFAIGAEPVRIQSVRGSGSTPEASLIVPDITILCTTVRAIFFENLIFSYFLSTSTSRHPMLQWRLCSQKRDYTIYSPRKSIIQNCFCKFVS